MVGNCQYQESGIRLCDVYNACTSPEFVSYTGVVAGALPRTVNVPHVPENMRRRLTWMWSYGLDNRQYKRNYDVHLIPFRCYGKLAGPPFYCLRLFVNAQRIAVL